MKHLLTLLAVLLNIGIGSAQIEVTDSTSTDWGGGTDIGVTPDNPTGKVTSLSLSQSRLLLSGGQQAQLVAIVNANAANKSVTWSVADNTIATVSANGLVTAVTTGQTVVTATSVDGGLTAQCLVTVRNNAKVYVERIDLDITEMEMYVGEVKTVTPTVYPENATDKRLRWEQRGAEYYNPALPDENHVFTAYKPGVMEIKLYPNDGSEAYAVCKITVKDRPLTKMTLPGEIVLNINEMMTLKPEVSPEPFQRKYKWTVADPSVAYISSSGRIIGVKAGTTTVTATALDGTGISASSKITVTSSVASMGYSGWILERGEDIHPWTARCFHEAGYSGKYAPNDSQGNKWYSPDYDDSSWGLTYGPLMNYVWPGYWGSEVYRTGYGQWELLDKSTLTIRQKFYLPNFSGYDFQVYARVYQSGEVYINGHRVDIPKDSYMAFIDPSYLNMGGENTIAIIGYPSGRDQYLDFGIHYETLIPVTRVVIKQKQLTLDIGATEQLEAVVKPAEATHQNLKWASLHPTVATVDQNGNVTGMGEGTATITATSVDGTNIVASCEVNVTNKTTTAVWVKDNGQNTPWTARYKYCLTTDNLYANGPANDALDQPWTAKYYDDSSWGTITGPIGHEVGNHYETLWPDDNSRYYLREAFTISDLASYRNPQLFLAHDDGIIVWINGRKVRESSVPRWNYYVDIPAGVLVEGNNVICVQVSEDVFGAYIDYGVSASTILEVVPVSSITLDKTAITLRRNEQAQLTASISPANAHFQEVEWTSSNPDIAIVDEEGNVRGISAGEAVITVSNKRGQLVTATCRVTVSNEFVPVKVGAWVIAPEDEWQAKIMFASNADELYTKEPNKDADGNKWTAFNYDDSKWETIQSPMDKAHGYFPDYSRYYVRSKFSLGDLSAVSSMRLRIAHDDEALVYINGILAANCSGARTEEVTIPSGIFVEGDNIICVNIHQGNGDAYLDFGLMGSSDAAPDKVSGISFEQETYTLPEGRNKKILPAITPQNVFTDAMVWSSSNPEVATVADDGTVTALSIGTAVITAVPVYGEQGVTASYTVVVGRSTLGGANSLPNVSFEFNYNACQYDEATHAIPNHRESDLSGYNLRLSGNIPTYDAEEGSLFMSSICRGWIDKWDFESTSSGAYFYRSGADDMTVVLKVAPDLDSRSVDFIANRGNGYNYMVRVHGDGNVFHLHTGTAYQPDRALPLSSEEEQVLVARVNGSDNYIQLDNLTTGESLRCNGVNWGGSNNIFKFFYNNDSEYFLGKYFWVYYSKEYLSDEDLNAVMRYNNEVLPSYIPAESIALENTKVTLAVGEKQQLHAMVLPENATEKDLYWISDNNDVVTVSSAGEVTALKEGTATIKVCSVSDDIEVQCKILVTPSTVNQGFSLSEGWNWISHCLSTPVSLDWLSSAERVVSQTEENYNDPQLGLVGDIESLLPGQAYKVKTDAALNQTVSGKLHDLSKAPIEMERGWNWVSYPFYQPLLLENAILGVEEDDRIISQQDGFAEYVDGEWFGTLSVLSPASGYLYKSSSKKAFEVDLFAPGISSLYQSVAGKDFTNQDSILSEEKPLYDKRIESQENPWVADPHAYPDLMCITADLFDGDSKAGEDRYCIAAFSGDECRGVGQYVKGILFLSVYGDQSVPITFLAAERATGEVYTILETVDFYAGVLGSVKAPFALHLGEAMDVNAIETDGVRTTSITNILGQKVNRMDVPGIYIINGKKVLIRNTKTK